MKQTIAVVGGTGNLGAALARRWAKAGRDVIIGSRTADKAREAADRLGGELGIHIRAASNLEAAQAADIVVITVPFASQRGVLEDIRPALAGKIVIDTNNYYFERDGHYAQLDAGSATVSGLLAAHLPTSRIVKAFNNIGWQPLLDDGLPSGDPNRRALAIAGDDAEAKAAVTALIDSFGFDVVDAGPLVEGRRFERDKPAYGPRATAAELTEMLARG